MLKPANWAKKRNQASVPNQYTIFPGFKSTRRRTQKMKFWNEKYVSTNWDCNSWNLNKAWRTSPSTSPKYWRSRKASREWLRKIKICSRKYSKRKSKHNRWKRRWKSSPKVWFARRRMSISRTKLFRIWSEKECYWMSRSEDWGTSCKNRIVPMSQNEIGLAILVIKPKVDLNRSSQPWEIRCWCRNTKSRSKSWKKHFRMREHSIIQGSLSLSRIPASTRRTSKDFSIKLPTWGTWPTPRKPRSTSCWRWGMRMPWSSNHSRRRSRIWRGSFTSWSKSRTRNWSRYCKSSRRWKPSMAKIDWRSSKK